MVYKKQKTVFLSFGEGIARFMSTGYSLKKYCGQLGKICQNLPRDARHAGSTRNVFLKTLEETLHIHDVRIILLLS
jgi:hypothetical protein